MIQDEQEDIGRYRTVDRVDAIDLSLMTQSADNDFPLEISESGLTTGTAQLWTEVCTELPVESQSTADEDFAADQESLKTKALLLWDEHEKCRSALAPILYVLCKKLNSQGKKGNGFRAWLQVNNKSKSTAYRWIREYCDANHKELPWPQKKEAKSKSVTSSHVGHALPIEHSNEQTLSSTPTPSTPAAKVAQLSEDAQISLLDIGTIAEMLKKAKELVQTPGEQYRSSMELFDVQTQEYAVVGTPEYNWFPQEQSVELPKAAAYIVALKTTLKALNRETRQVHSQLKALETYIKRLNDNDQPFYQVVPKKLASPANEIQKEAA